MSAHRRSQISLKSWTLLTVVLTFILTFALSAGSMETTAETSSARASGVQVQESGIRARLQEDGVAVSVPVTGEGRVVLALSLMDDEDKEVAKAEVPATLNLGTNVIPAKLSLAEGWTSERLPWFRIRYAVAKQGSKRALADGIVSVGTVVPDLFDVRVIYQKKVTERADYTVRVQAFNPVTMAPASNVRLTARLSFEDNDEEKEKLPVTAHTNGSGIATLHFKIPAQLAETEGTVEIEARSGEQVKSQSIDIELDTHGEIIINTDKSLYQPGQAFHARAMVFDANKRAIPEAAIEFKLEDPDDSTAYSTTATTNKFGVASFDWQLPESLRLGRYTLKAEITAPDRYSSVEGSTSVRVSRYDLPEFTVTTKLNKAYYLPGQNAEVDVSGIYLFGKPVTHGSVRLVQEQHREWDYEEQKWEVEESAEQKGELDGSGHVKFTLDLKKLFDDFPDSRYRRYVDASFAAYVTDKTTGKTEQRRFKVRLSNDAIHVYAMEQQVAAGKNSAQLYVTTAYPDGSPASCTVAMSELIEKSRPEGTSSTPVYLRTVKTNRYGVAKIANLRFVDADSGSESHTLIFQASDNHGANTRYESNIYSGSERKHIQVTTEKALYAKGEPIVVRLASEPMEGRTIVSAVVKGAAVWTSMVNLRRGRAMFTVPYQPEFVGNVAITAYQVEGESRNRWETPSGQGNVLYPHDSDLRVSIKTDRNAYKPGEPVTATLRAASASGGSDATALGVVIVDKAVEERARTDEDFSSGRYGFWNWWWWYDYESIGGVTLRDLEKLDMSEPVPEGLDLVAELLLRRSYFYDLPEVESPEEYDDVSKSMYQKWIVRQLEPVRRAVFNQMVNGWKFPTQEAELDRLLSVVKIDRHAVRDPWNSEFKYEFDADVHNLLIRMTSAGPDKRFGTADDLSEVVAWNYFTNTGAAIENAVKLAFAESGVTVHDVESLRALAKRAGLDIDGLRDPWGNNYEFKCYVFGTYSRVEALSNGPGAPKAKWPQPLIVWSSYVDYFSITRERLDDAMRISRKTTGRLPHNDEELDKALALAEFVKFRQLRDPWGNPFRTVYSQSYDYRDTTQIVSTAAGTTEQTTPVTRKFDWVLVVSNGPDGKPDTRDDVTLARFSNVVEERSGKQAAPVKLKSSAVAKDGSAILEGVVTDQSGAVIPGATVTALETRLGFQYSALTNDRGEYVLMVLPGVYNITVSAKAFRSHVQNGITLNALSSVRKDVILTVGASSEMVEVTAESSVTNTQSLMMMASVSSKMAQERPLAKDEIFTPRMRDYFPETLYWEPSLITTKGGTAKLSFKLADSITTWKMSVLASTADGQIGATEMELQAFQPFFVALDPPKVLTVGDHMELPVTVRNYLPKSQTMQIEMKPADWFKLTEAGKQQITIPSADSMNAIFAFTTLLPVKAGKQQVVAANGETGDAIEKPVKVHPDGQEESRSVSTLMKASETLSLELPDKVMPNSLQGELKIYSNLLAHVGESIEGSLQRPHGCGEQTISSTYPSVLMLKYEKAAGVAESELSRKAKKYLAMGYQRLLSYQSDNGGFSYWGKSSQSDVALTAYAIRFLTDASTLMEVDEDVISGARGWLVSQQAKDGAWLARYGESQGTTAYVARVLAGSMKGIHDEKEKNKVKDAVEKALNKLDDPQAPMREPYTLSMYAMAASEIGAKEQATAAVGKLSAVSHKEANGTFWELQTNTPFYGWGRAGMVESSAVAVQALVEVGGDSATERDQVASGLLFLLKQKDRYGVWYSGQATVNVLEAMLKVLGDSGKAKDAASTATFTVNGKPAGEVQLTNTGGPVYVDVTPYLGPGHNEIVLKREGAGQYASVQAVADYYVPWKGGGDVREATRLGESRALRLAVKFDKSEVKVGDAVRCSVTAERIGHRGYGMLLAEVGMPPGADVDRASLEAAIEASGWDISQYDVLPDRVVLYLWPRAGGTKVEFTFRPRFGMKARTSQSVMYDYYNPDEQVTLAPMDFSVSSK